MRNKFVDIILRNIKDIILRNLSASSLDFLYFLDNGNYIEILALKSCEKKGL